MSVPSWPSALQEKMNEADFQYLFGPTSIRSNNDVGLAKVRRRFTKGVDGVTCSILLRASQFDVLYDFWDLDLNGGVNQFSYDHPFTGETRNWRMVDPPAVSPVGGETLRAVMVWELVP